MLLGVASLLVVGGCSDEGSGDAGSSAAPTSSTTPAPSSTQPGTSGPGTGGATGTSPAPPGDADPASPSDRPTLPPVALEAPADFGTGMTARITASENVEVTAQGPGEISGPALALTVEFTNDSPQPVDLSSVTVSLDYSGQEASGFTSPPAQPVRPEVAAGASASGVYVFAVPTEDRADVTVSVGYAASQPVVIFHGDATS